MWWKKGAERAEDDCLDLQRRAEEAVRQKRIARDELLWTLRRQERLQLGREMHTLNQVVRMIGHD